MEVIGRIGCRCCGKSSNVMYDQKSGEAVEDGHGDITCRRCGGGEADVGGNYS
ncbi:MAG: hypothetical protein R6U85_03840 [Salinivirgaceae bacterium]